jgi:serine phosphatase RsbU (regulator of sigma subunit)/sugar lactone lactonase YvrE
MEGNIWLGTYGKGAAAMVDQAFLFYNYTDTPLGNNILSIATDTDSSILWLGSPNGILETNQLVPDKQKFFGLKEGLPHDKITALYLDKNSRKLWIGTSESGIYTMNTSTKKITSFFSSQNSLDNSINYIVGSGGKIWVATNNGVFAFNPATGAHEHWSTNEGLPHNKISQLYIDPTGIVWIATKSNSLYAVNADKRYKIDGNVELEFKAITADNAGNLWACTDGDGVFRFSDDTLHWFSTDDGLRSNYGYSMITDQNGDIWTGHRLAISRIDAVTFKIKGFGTESGISGDCNNNAVALGSNGRILFGTTDGLVIYNTRQDETQQQPPVTNITALRINDKEVQPEENITLPYGSYKLRIEYIGLNYQDPKEVYYQYKMVGYDVDTSWSEPTKQTYVQYGRITDGNFVFKIRSCNQSGICNETPVTLHIRVKLPVWKTWWFITLSFILLIVIIYLIIKIRERKQIQFQKFLQEKLDERTREVIEQKEEIEIKNKDITDSINYAQRIQASILPSIKKLHQNFSGCFVFYQPRDIVSGDFYWFDRISEDKFVIVCADSTGHGVPGAFMSMIGTTLIKDICSRDPEQSPSNILTILDREIHNTLNQNIEAERSNDGMDIIVCEINISNYYVRFASAMRPLIVYQNGEEVYIKGSRSTIGGSYAKEDKVFEDEGLQLSKGDIIYMFSDGYPDQFGGPMGKKFKMVRLKNLLRDIYQKPMDEQYEFVKNNFMLWKDENEQVDDVLFMGIKI